MPRYEVKFLLSADKVLVSNEPSEPLKKLLGIRGQPEKRQMQFLDSQRRELHAEGWDVRFRPDEKDARLELTYKRRFKIDGDDIDAALATAARQGFDASEKNYEAEVEWGMTRKTLSFTRELKVKGSDGAALPEKEEARKLALKELPGKLSHWVRDGWAQEVLKDGHNYGPVSGQRWTGKKDDIDDEIVLEVWQIRKKTGEGTEPLVEVSFKKKEKAKANASRARLLGLLQGQNGWLSRDDVLKTELILERFH